MAVDGQDDGDVIVVTADAAIQITGNHNPLDNDDEQLQYRGVGDTHRGDHDGSRRGDLNRHYDHANILVDEEMNGGALPKEQIDMLMRENEEIRRQIAEVKN